LLKLNVTILSSKEADKAKQSLLQQIDSTSLPNALTSNQFKSYCEFIYKHFNSAKDQAEFIERSNILMGFTTNLPQYLNIFTDARTKNEFISLYFEFVDSHAPYDFEMISLSQTMLLEQTPQTAISFLRLFKLGRLETAAIKNFLSFIKTNKLELKDFVDFMRLLPATLSNNDINKLCQLFLIYTANFSQQDIAFLLSHLQKDSTQKEMHMLSPLLRSTFAAQINNRVSQDQQHIFFRIAHEFYALINKHSKKDVQNKLNEYFDFNNPELDQARIALMHLLFQQALVLQPDTTGQNWSNDENDRLLQFCLQKYTDHAKLILTRKNKQRLGRNHDLSLDQHQQLLKLTSELQLISSSKLTAQANIASLVGNLLTGGGDLTALIKPAALDTDKAGDIYYQVSDNPPVIEALGKKMPSVEFSDSGASKSSQSSEELNNESDEEEAFNFNSKPASTTKKQETSISSMEHTEDNDLEEKENKHNSQPSNTSGFGNLANMFGANPQFAALAGLSGLSGQSGLDLGTLTSLLGGNLNLQSLGLSGLSADMLNDSNTKAMLSNMMGNNAEAKAALEQLSKSASSNNAPIWKKPTIRISTEVSKSNHDTLAQSLNRSLKNYSSAFFKSSLRKEQFKNLQAAISKQLQSKTPRYDEILATLKQAKNNAMSQDIDLNQSSFWRRWIKSHNSGSKSRLYNTLNQMYDNVLTSWSQDLNACHSMGKYHDYLERDLHSISRKIGDGFASVMGVKTLDEVISHFSGDLIQGWRDAFKLFRPGLQLAKFLKLGRGLDLAYAYGLDMLNSKLAPHATTLHKLGLQEWGSTSALGDPLDISGLKQLADIFSQLSEYANPENMMDNIKKINELISEGPESAITKLLESKQLDLFLTDSGKALVRVLPFIYLLSQPSPIAAVIINQPKFIACVDKYMPVLAKDMPGQFKLLFDEWRYNANLLKHHQESQKKLTEDQVNPSMLFNRV
ncbi:MAG TPA: hypothetical protein VHA13_01845, partial [Gammaproteobacteria bacterium]|nr:hypothetical protein [Gammaproteobacteria bacterium]